MSIPIGSDLVFVNDSKITGLLPATAPGQPIVFEQMVGTVSAVESVTIVLPNQLQSYEISIARVGTLANQNIRAWLAGTIDSDDNDLWQLEGVMVNAECLTDAVQLFLSCQYFESGNIKINYQVF